MPNFPLFLKAIYDSNNNLIGALAPNGKPAYFAGSGGAVVVATGAPNNADGRPDGTVYVQAP